MKPNLYVLDGKTKSITPADLEAVTAQTNQGVNPYWPIYRVHVVSANEIEVWYGRHDTPDRGMFDRYRRSKQRGEWKWVGSGGHQT